MIPRNNTSEHTLRWKKIFADSFFGHDALSAALPQLDIDKKDLTEIDKQFPIQVARDIVENKADSHFINDPVLRQYLPNKSELVNPEGYTDDPVV